MTICSLEALLVFLSGKFVVLLDFQPDHTIDELRVGFIDQNFKDWITVLGALKHLNFVKLEVTRFIAIISL